jgi:hypothetical protein
LTESKALSSFWHLYERLPESTRRAADKQFALFRQDPTHPSLHFKQVGEFWSVRVTGACRALALRENSVFYWFWIGDHDEYERLIAG